jgi:hypothetical protein
MSVGVEIDVFFILVDAFFGWVLVFGISFTGLG